MLNDRPVLCFLDGATPVFLPFPWGRYRQRQWIMGTLYGALTIPTLALASTGDVGNIIQTFPVRQFPNAAGHYWVINETPWDGDEMIVDAHTIVNERRAMEPDLSHFLPLIVAGERRGIQRIPLEPGADRRAEEGVYAQFFATNPLSLA